MNTAQYLLRFDDICPTMNWKVWGDIETLLIQRGIKPILAIVPDNCDPGLQADAPASDFWDRARSWQERGWTIALHGYQHRYVSPHAGLVAVRKKSEFAGLPADQQREKLRRGMEIFERERIRARVWIAPGNTFDDATVGLLPEFGIKIICDGYFRYPHVCQRGMVWVPHQIFGFRPAPAGVWTVCYHHNEWDAALARQFRMDLDEYAARIVSLEEALERRPPRKSRLSSWLCVQPRLSRFLIRVELKLWRWTRNLAARPASTSLAALQLFP